MEKQSFNPNGIGIDNGRFIGLPFQEEDAKVVVVSVPWDVTVSYTGGTAQAPMDILKESLQLDLFVPEIADAWNLGVYVRPSDEGWHKYNADLRSKASKYIAFLEKGGELNSDQEMQKTIAEINSACDKLNQWVYSASKELMAEGKLPAILGGEHSVPLGLLKALSEKHGPLAVLQFDAHMDLRKNYEGFHNSHASVFYNAINQGYVSDLVQVGIRDNCEEEVLFARQNKVKVFYDHDIKAKSYQGVSWQAQCIDMIAHLPKEVYVSFDIDGLNPHLCPNTGTPVPGGLEFAEAVYLIKELVKSGRTIIGFDLCEVGGGHAWDSNVGARILYCLCNWAGRSQGWI